MAGAGAGAGGDAPAAVKHGLSDSEPEVGMVAHAGKRARLEPKVRATEGVVAEKGGRIFTMRSGEWVELPPETMEHRSEELSTTLVVKNGYTLGKTNLVVGANTSMLEDFHIFDVRGSSARFVQYFDIGEPPILIDFDRTISLDVKERNVIFCGREGLTIYEIDDGHIVHMDDALRVVGPHEVTVTADTIHISASGTKDVHLLDATFPYRRIAFDNFAAQWWDGSLLAPDGSTLFLYSEDRLVAWDIRGRTVRREVSTGIFLACRFSPDSRTVLCWTKLHTVALLTFPGFDTVWEIELHHEMATPRVSDVVVFSPNGGRLLVFNKVLDARDGSSVFDLPDSFVGRSKFSPDGSNLVCHSRKYNALYVYSTQTGQCVRILKPLAEHNIVDFEFSGRDMLNVLVKHGILFGEPGVPYLHSVHMPAAGTETLVAMFGASRLQRRHGRRFEHFLEQARDRFRRGDLEGAQRALAAAGEHVAHIKPEPESRNPFGEVVKRMPRSALAELMKQTGRV